MVLGVLLVAGKKTVKAYIIHNPASGRFKEEEYASLIASLNGRGIETVGLGTERSRHAEELARQAVLEPERIEVRKAIVAIGGDGLLGEVLDGLVPLRNYAKEDFVYLPFACGTANDGARVAGVPNSKEAEKRILGYCEGSIEPRELNVFQVEASGEKRHTFVHAGMGITGDISEWMHSGRGKDFKKSLGSLAYPLSGLYFFLGGRARDVFLQIGEGEGAFKSEGKIYSVDAGQIESMGGIKKYFPGATPFGNDGARVLVIGEKLTKPLAPLALGLASFGAHTGFPGISYFREGADYSGEIAVSSEKPFPVDVAGEPIGNAYRMVVRKLQGAVRTI